MADVERLLEIMAKLRDPQGGCPWDLEQSFESVAPFTLEEAYEVDHAIREADMEGLCDELGDLLFQVVFHARMAEEAGHFAFGDVVDAICDKLERRHPHVFGEARIESAQQQTVAWEALKAEERRRRAAARGHEPSVFEGLPRALPALARAVGLRKRAEPASPPPSPQRVAELAGRLSDPGDPSEGIRDLGELLSHCAELARRAGLDPEEALRQANQRFEEQVRAGGDSAPAQRPSS
jgi:uncharacterized protein YabN with tetrapyrrole methylase and pyrophosphatase domain